MLTASTSLPAPTAHTPRPAGSHALPGSYVGGHRRPFRTHITRTYEEPKVLRTDRPIPDVDGIAPCLASGGTPLS